MSLQRLLVCRAMRISMLVTLQHKVCFCIAYNVIKHPPLYQIVALSPYGIQRMMEHHYAMVCLYLLHLRLKPRCLGKEEEDFTVRIEQEECRIVILQSKELIVVVSLFHAFQEVREGQ